MMRPTISAQEFVDKWRHATLKESAAAQQHFCDLCRLVGHPTPAEVDPKGEWFTFEAGASKTSGGQGWADVWKKRFFAWEYKGKHKDLDTAYEQLVMAMDTARETDDHQLLFPEVVIDAEQLLSAQGRLEAPCRTALEDAGISREDLDEVIQLSDVIHVISEGRLAPEFPRGTKTPAELGLWMAGQGFEGGAHAA